MSNLSTLTYPHLSFQLDNEFVESYAKRPVTWGFPCGGGNTLGEITWITKYSRLIFDPELGRERKEKFYEGCRRVIEGMYSAQMEFCLAHRTPWEYTKALRSAEEAYERLFLGKWSPPGRGWWMMGSEFTAANGSAALQNCFSGDTEIITKDGIKSFNQIVNKEVEVWTKKGWKLGIVSCFGEQSTQQVTFAPTIEATHYLDGSKFHRNLRSNIRHKINVTPNHKWILNDGSETTNLSVGDVVQSNVVDEFKYDNDAWLHGFIFGDGCTSSGHRYTNGDCTVTVRLCGKKARFLDRFYNWRVLRHLSGNGDPTCYLRSSSNHWKSTPNNMSSNYARNFIQGWMDADGDVAKFRLSTTSQEGVDWINRYSAFAGYLVAGHTIEKDMITNYGKRNYPHQKITLRNSDNTSWKVVSIENNRNIENVFCATVPDVESFTLAKGIYTGNCAFLSTKDLNVNASQTFTLLMEMSMLGIGVGFDTRGVGQVTIKDKSDRPARTYIVKDSREGWCKSVELLLERFLATGHRVRFDYSLVRDAGQPIKGFGGQSAGPEPLKKLHQQLITLFADRPGELITELDIVDICNMIGKCVVSANVRSSAEIALSEQHGQDFMDAKNWEIYPERNGPDGWGYTSNNSLIAKVGDDYTNVAESVADKGEPGLFYLDLARAYGRMVDPPTNDDFMVFGVNPCGEQPLFDRECCTLAETYPMNCDDREDYIRTLKFAFLYGKTVTLVPTHWPEVNQVMQRNRRIGLSMTGCALFVERKGYAALRDWCNGGYAAVQEWDQQYSRWLGIRESIKTTTIKPGGTVPLLIARPGLMGNPPGAHWPRASGAYIRTMRSSVNEPIIKVMEAAGYLIEPNFSNPVHGRVITLPVMGEEMRSEEDVPLWEKVELAKLLQRYWSDNSVSATFSFMPDEASQVASIIHVNEGQLKSLSFLPIDNNTYAQMPYSTIEREKWDEYSATIKPINWDTLYYGEDARDASGELYCTTDACEIKELM